MKIVEVLISAMHQKNLSIVGRTKINTNILVINQCDENIQQVLHELKIVIENDMTMSDLYQERITDFFILYDTKNCERTYEMVKKLALT